MTEQLKQLVISYLDALYDGTDIYTSTWRLSDKIDEASRLPQFSSVGGVSIANGVSKICLVFSNLPVVVKWSMYEDCGEALAEAKIYKDAVSSGLAFFFPETELLVKKYNISFVIQEKIDCSAHSANRDKKYEAIFKRVTKTPTEKIYKKIQDGFNKADSDYRRTLDQTWAKMAISLYGKKACKNLCKFVKDHRINDLHNDNIGYKNFKPILIDFSGYHQ